MNCIKKIILALSAACLWGLNNVNAQTFSIVETSPVTGTVGEVGTSFSGYSSVYENPSYVHDYSKEKLFFGLSSYLFRHDSDFGGYDILSAAEASFRYKSHSCFLGLKYLRLSPVENINPYEISYDFGYSHKFGDFGIFTRFGILSSKYLLYNYASTFSLGIAYGYGVNCFGKDGKLEAILKISDLDLRIIKHTSVMPSSFSGGVKYSLNISENQKYGLIVNSKYYFTAPYNYLKAGIGLEGMFFDKFTLRGSIDQLISKNFYTCDIKSGASYMISDILTLSADAVLPVNNKNPYVFMFGINCKF